MRLFSKLVLLVFNFSVVFVFGQFRLPQYDGKNQYTKLNSAITGMTLCKGPKRQNCSVNKLDHKPGDFNNLTFTLKFDKPVTFQRYKMAIWFGKNGTTKHAPDSVRWIDNPCSHFFLKTMLRIFNVTPDCKAKKGVYKFSLDLRAFFYDVFGFQYHYGNHLVQSLLLEKNCNIICTSTTFSILENRRGKDTTSAKT